MQNTFFLGAQSARITFEQMVLPSIQHAMERGYFSRRHMHIVVLAPNIPYSDDTPLPILFEYSIGAREEWEKWDGKTFDDFARGKAMLTWRTGLPSREVVQHNPHLLMSGDIILWGSDILNGQITAISGVQPEFDEMYSRMTNAALNAMALFNAGEYLRKNTSDFLPM